MSELCITCGVRPGKKGHRQRDHAAAQGGAVKEVKHLRLEACVLQIP